MGEWQKYKQASEKLTELGLQFVCIEFPWLINYEQPEQQIQTKLTLIENNDIISVTPSCMYNELFSVAFSCLWLDIFIQKNNYTLSHFSWNALFLARHSAYRRQFFFTSIKMLAKSYT